MQTFFSLISIKVVRIMMFSLMMNTWSLKLQMETNVKTREKGPVVKLQKRKFCSASNVVLHHLEED